MNNLSVEFEKYLEEFDFEENPMTDEEINRLYHAYIAGWNGAMNVSCSKKNNRCKSPSSKK